MLSKSLVKRLSLWIALAQVLAPLPGRAAPFEYKPSVPGLVVTQPSNTTNPSPTPSPDPSPVAPPGGTGASTLIASAASVDFASVDVGQQSALRSVTLTNSGSSSVSLSVPAVSGAGFSKVASTCGATLSVGQACTVDLRFAPASAGAVIGALSVANGASGTPLTVALTGTGVVRVSTARWENTTLGFGGVKVGSSSTKSVVLHNDGSLAADYSQILGVTAGVAVNASGCANVAGGGSCTVSFTYSPTSGVSYSATNIAPSTGGHSNVLTITGQGLSTSLDLSSGSLAFGSQAVNTTSASKSVAILNTGTDTVSIGALTVSGSAFAAETNCSSSLAAGDSCALTVRFTPTTGGNLYGQVTLGTGAGAQTVDLTGYGVTPITATLSSDFTSVQTPSGAFASTAVGSSRTLTLYVLNSGNAGEVAVSGTLSGSSAFSFVNAERIYPYYQGGVGWEYNFRGCDAAWTATTLTNCYGAVDSGTGNSGVDFRILAITLKFQPSATGSHAATLSLSHNGVNTSPLILNLTGTATGTPVASLSTTEFAYGSIDVGTSSTLSVRLTNTGTATLSLTSAPALTGNAAFVFPATGGTDCGASLAPAAYCDTTVKFTPSAAGAVSGTLSFATNAAGSPATVLLSGTGLQAIGSLVATTGSSTDFGSVVLGRSSTNTFTFTNTGNKAATGVYASVTNAQLAVTSTTCGSAASPVTVANGTSCSVTVTYTPTSVSTLSGAAVQVTSSAANSPSSLAVSGSGGSAVVTLQSFGARTWSDGTLAGSCNAYLHPTGVYAYSGDTGDGLYRIKPSGESSYTDVYCNMTTDGGGWTLVMRGNGGDVTGWNTTDALNAALGSAATAPSGGTFKFADSFINNVRTSTGIMKFTASGSALASTVTRYFAAHTYAHTAVRNVASAATTSYATASLTGGRSGTISGYLATKTELGVTDDQGSWNVFINANDQGSSRWWLGTGVNSTSATQATANKTWCGGGTVGCNLTMWVR